MVKRHHEMPFGPQFDAAGGVRFRLWAPTAVQAAVCLNPARCGPGNSAAAGMKSGGGDERIVAMERCADEAGWFVSKTLAAAEIETYCFEVGIETNGKGDEPGGRKGGDRLRVSERLRVPDPASRAQAAGVHGPSVLVNGADYTWTDDDWQGRPWSQTVAYEIHVGTFSPQGDFAGVCQRLDYLQDLGVTALELMPVADFPGDRNWGYDGVLPFAPAQAYGRPADLKQLVEAAHRRGLMVFLDVVYNHFGPEGNYLYVYAKDFFTPHHQTPWGEAINFDGAHSGWVREFFIHNAMYWLAEYHLDGLRLDAVHAIRDDSRPHILTELAARVRTEIEQKSGRQIHLVLENDANEARYLRRDRASDSVSERGNLDGAKRGYDAQWNDDFHHAFHVLLSGEGDGYYADYAADPRAAAVRCLRAGFAYQGEPSPFRDGALRGEPTKGLAPTAFVSFVQNHDQVGNRALGERLGMLEGVEAQALEAVTAVWLLAPQVPLLFMGQEWNAQTPFLFFCDFGPELAAQVTAGRRAEFARFKEFSDPQARRRIPDPADPETFARCRLQWGAHNAPAPRRWLDLHKHLLRLRAEAILPLGIATPMETRETKLGERAFAVEWEGGQGKTLCLRANLGPTAVGCAPVGAVGEVSEAGEPEVLFVTPARFQTQRSQSLKWTQLEPWSVIWYLTPKKK